MNRKRIKTRNVLVGGGMMVVVLLIFSPMSSTGQQPMILRNPVILRVDPQVLEQQRMLQAEQQRRQQLEQQRRLQAEQQRRQQLEQEYRYQAEKQLRRQNNEQYKPVQVDSRRMEGIEVRPNYSPPPPGLTPQSPTVQDPATGLGQPPSGQESRPISGTVQIPPPQDPEPGLGQQPKPSHSTPGCFIATAAYGSPLAGNIAVLEKFRDKYLLTNPFGQRFVAFYYRNSPPVAEYIAGHEGLRFATRAALWPLVYSIKHPLQAVVILLIMGTTLGIFISRKRHGGKIGLAID